MLAALVSQLCEKELREERCLLERLSLSGWAGTHVEMFRGNFRLEMWSSGAGENEGETYFSGEEIIGKEDWRWRMVLRHLGRGKEPAWKTEERGSEPILQKLRERFFGRGERNSSSVPNIKEACMALRTGQGGTGLST